jgi:hypothetical protein
MMENSLFVLNSVSDMCLNPSTTILAMGMILALVCGLGLFFLSMPCFKSYPFSPPAGKKTLRKVRNLHTRPTIKESLFCTAFTFPNQEVLDLSTLLLQWQVKEELVWALGRVHELTDHMCGMLQVLG